VRIPVADDSEVFRALLAATFEDPGHSVTKVGRGLAAREELAHTHYSVLISDWIMPGKNGPDLCRAIRESFGLNSVYIILITSLSGEHDYLDGMAAGADDFMSKPSDTEHLKSRLHAAAQLLALHEELRERAFRDRLTGLLNRGAILDALDRELHSAARDGRGLAIFLVDVDHFSNLPGGCRSFQTSR